METLETYLNGLFAAVPQTPSTAKAKQDLLDLMTDHYHEELAKGHSEATALGLVIGEFGDIDELLAALDVDPIPDTEPNDRPEMTDDDVDGYWAGTERFARLLGLGIALVIAAPGVAATLSIDSGALAALGFIAPVALGIGLIIATSMGYRTVSRAMRALASTPAIRARAAGQADAYSRPRTIGLVGGIMMCILSVVPPIAANTGAFEGAIGAGGLFLFVAIGVYYIVYTSIVAGGFQRLTRQPSVFVDTLFDPPAPRPQAAPPYTKPTTVTAKPRRDKVRYDGWRAFYWPCLITGFLLFGFLGGEWTFAWFLLIVGGLFEKPLFGRTKR
ncbi:hypothetical protein [Lacticaseibacillus absianus]|uniref:hypothetical protein n=1 Tax=Lacticaseibacillus absianus TaxID=2729623 RepID=UPI0015CCD482|nr:hypothetical protein [Lacticaseibacillus absianus]